MNRTLTIAALAAAGALILTGCGGASDDGWRGATHCDTLTHEGTHELFAQDRWTCIKDGVTSEVYTFTNSEARDRWRAAAEYFGAEVLDQGDDWIVVES
jgi:hypothetical protein